jgi:uncharacterized protein YaiI (UPF0178 family)
MSSYLSFRDGEGDDRRPPDPENGRPPDHGKTGRDHPGAGSGETRTRPPTLVAVDADACPRGALDTVRRLQVRHDFRVLTVASVNHIFTPWGPGHVHVVTGPEPEATDLALANRIRRGDAVVTQDWGLAALALGRGCRAISPTGRVYRPETIDLLLEERRLKAKFRRGGGRTRGPRARTAEDEARFERALLWAIMVADDPGEGEEV